MARSRDDRLRAVGFMVLGVASLSCMDALGKKVAAGYSVFQMLAIRSTLALLVLTVFLAAAGRLGSLRTAQRAGHAVRSLCGLVAFVSFYAALRHLPLADAVAIAFGSPFLVTALARVFLGERAGLGRWIAIAVGFLGMLVIVRPRGGGGVHPAALLILVSAFAYAVLMLLTRWMTRPERPPESTWSFVFYMLLGQATVGWMVAAGAWRAPEPWALAQMAGMGAFALLGNYGLAEAFRLAPVAIVAPFEYTGLIWAVLLGALVFGDIPATSFWLGSAIIIGAGLYALRAEQPEASATPVRPAVSP